MSIVYDAPDVVRWARVKFMGPQWRQG